MNTLSIDLETYSDIDLKSAGVYKYVSSPNFLILLLAYKWNDELVKIIDLTKDEGIPHYIQRWLFDEKVIKTAYNASFERLCLRQYGIDVPINQWRCTMVHAAYLGLPGSLGNVAEALKMPADKKKMGIGGSLIRYFCCPCKPTKANEGRTRNLPHHDPGKWEQFKEYCKQDVVTEDAIRTRLSKFPVPENEWKLYQIDQEINDRGVLVDQEFVQQAIKCDEQYQAKVLEEAVQISGLQNPRSVAQIKKWMLDNEGEEVGSLDKKAVPKLIEKMESQTAKRILELRQEMARTSVKKYQKMLDCICPDGRIHGTMQFYGANRTGRWAGRLVQVHNLPRNYIKDLTLARQIIKSGDFEGMEFLYGNVPDTLSQLIRTAFIPSPGYKFIVSDFSAIEARVIAWLAGEDWRMEVFRTHGKIYEASAAAMFHIPIDQVDKELRQRGKVAELALGYQGGKGALVKMGALDMGLKEDELQGLVDAWRRANPKIVRLWSLVQDAAMATVKEKSTRTVGNHLTFTYERGMLFIRLPSGRRLSYVRPQLEPGKFGNDQITYEGVQDNKKWGRIATYGGMLVENIVQAIARDCLARSLYRVAHSYGHDVVMHIHDEIVIEELNADSSDLDLVNALMSEPIPWAPRLPLKAAGFITDYYRKD